MGAKLLWEDRLNNKSKLYPKDVLGSLFSEEPNIAEIAREAKFPNQATGLGKISDILSKFNVRVLAFNLTSKKIQKTNHKENH